MTGYLRGKAFVVLMLIVAASMSSAQRVAKIPAGASLQVRIVERLNSETTNVGDKFHGNLALPIQASGRTLFPQGAEITGEVVNVERSGRLSNPGELHLRLRTIRSGQRLYVLNVPDIMIKGESHAKSNVAKIGGTTAFGAIVGALAGGGKGAAIGATVGAAAGTGAAAATGKKAAVVESESILVWAMPVPQEQAAPPQPEPQLEPQSEPEVQAQYPPQEVERPDMRRERRDDRYEQDQDDDGDYARGGPEGFSTYDHRMITECFVDDRGGLPPGLAKRDHLPPGLERQMQRNGTLPPGLQRHAQSLPERCESRLPRLPRDWSRVVVGGRVLLLDPNLRIVDLFWLQGD